jgi:hypothetical protein
MILPPFTQRNGRFKTSHYFLNGEIYFSATTQNRIFVSVSYVFSSTAIRDTTRIHRVPSDGMTAARYVLCGELLPSIGRAKKCSVTEVSDYPHRWQRVVDRVYQTVW